MCFSELTKMLVYKFLLRYPALMVFVSSQCHNNALRENKKSNYLPATGSWVQTRAYT